MPRRGSDALIAHALPAVPDTHWRDRLFFAAFYLFAFIGLGVVVSSRFPTPVDTSARWFAGLGLPYALLLTRAGTFPVYFTLSVVALVLGIVNREHLRAVLISIVTLLVAWQVSDACKVFYHRPRPNYWHLIHEPTFSYPSGHTTLVVAFYGFWTAVAWAGNISLAAKRWIRLGFAALALGIGWSRLALGAHYLTDLVGGYLLGAAMASLGMLAFRALGPAEPAARR